MSSRFRILVADDEPNLLAVIAAVLRKDGYEVVLSKDGEEALRALQQNEVNLVLTDVIMPKVSGLELLRHVLRLRPGLPIVLMTAYGNIRTAVDAMKLGAYDYIAKPFEMDEMRAIVSRGLARAGRAARAAPKSGRTPAGSTRAASAVVGRGEWRKRLLEIVEKVAASRATVLLSGESGTGKELFAREIHSSSPRANKPFIAVACAALSRDLLESELFGHEKGAFTGAHYQKPGRFELANEGTLFLDEIGEIPLDLQVKLLRVLQEREFERVGGTETIKVDVRLLAATNKDLAESVGRGEFREDLYYRLQVVEIHLPPLRERREDIADLAAHFLTQYAAENGRALREIGPDALAVLEAHSWPGNVRELENAIEHSVVMADPKAEILTRDLLPAGLLAQAAPGLERRAPSEPRAKRKTASKARSRSAKRG